MKKRIISLFLVLTLLVLCLPLNVFATDNDEGNIDFGDFNVGTQIVLTEIYVDSTWCNAGKTVDVDINILNNIGISGAKFIVEFDEKLSLVSWETDGVFKELDYTAPEKLTSPVPFNWDSLDATATENGTIITLTFEVSSDVEPEDILDIKLSYNYGDIYDSNLDSVSVALKDGSLRVIDYMPGDVNDDGVVNGKDVTLIRRYNAGGNVDINTTAADVNEDEVINGKDVTLIRRVNAGWPVELLPGILKCEHEISTVEAKEATCVDDGNIIYYICKKCNSYFIDEEATIEVSKNRVVVSAKGHNLSEVELNEATCTEEGNVLYYKCSECDKYFADEKAIIEITPSEIIIPARDHSISLVGAKEATCTEDGNIKCYKCSRCNKYFSDEAATVEIDAADVVIAAKGHTLTEHASKEATCTENGNVSYYSCSVCNKCFSDETTTVEIDAEKIIVSASGHATTPVKEKAATCTENGNIACFKCLQCNQYFSDENGTAKIDAESIVVLANGHSISAVAAKEATFTESGNIAYYKCSKCNKFFSDENATVEIEEKDTVIPKIESYMVTYYDDKVEGYPKYEHYAQNTSITLPVIEKEGYIFSGWWTAVDGEDGTGERVVLIPAGNSENKVLYADWDAKEYSITYKNAGNHNNPPEYTVETETFKLNDPVWSGLIFKNWTDKNGNEITKIENGSTGNITLYANWIYEENYVKQSDDKTIRSILLDEESNSYYFIYELGFIDNVELKVIESQDKSGTTSIVWTKSETVTVGKEMADSVSETVSYSVSQTNGWSEAKELFTENYIGGTLTVGAGFENKAIGVKASIEGSVTKSTTNGTKREYTTTGSNTGTTESSNEVSSTLSFSESNSVTVTTEKTVTSDAPAGNYRNACVGRVNVYAIITYDIANECYHFDTFSVLDDTVRGKILYTPSSNSTVNVSSSVGFDLSFLKDDLSTSDENDGVMRDIFDNLESVYYVSYDSNGGEGTMLTSVFDMNKSYSLIENSFSRPGYVFTGWGVTAKGAPIYMDNAEVQNIASKGETLTLYAIWQPIPHTVSWNLGANVTTTVKRTSSPAGASIGALTSGATVYYGDVLQISYIAENGYTLSSKGAEKITVGTEDITSSLIYATAKANTYKVVYDPNGATAGTVWSETHTYGKENARALSENLFVKDGYDFIGWSTDPTDTVPEYENTAYVYNLTNVSNGSVTLYALWIKVTHTCTENYGMSFKTIGPLTHSETFYPELERDRLKENKYKSLELTIKITGKGNNIINDKPFIIIYSHQNEKVATIYLNDDFPFTEASTEVVKSTISLNNVQTDGSFWIRFDNDGGAFVLYSVVVEVKAVK